MRMKWPAQYAYSGKRGQFKKPIHIKRPLNSNFLFYMTGLCSTWP